MSILTKLIRPFCPCFRPMSKLLLLRCGSLSDEPSANVVQTRQRGVSSVPFPGFYFPFNYVRWELVSSGISSQSVQNILIRHVT